MNRKRLFAAVAITTLALSAIPLPSARAGGLSIDRYIALSIARLELAKQAWSATRQPPTRESMATLFASYGIDEADYLGLSRISGEHIISLETIA
jgi:hypothetical protein